MHSALKSFGKKIGSGDHLKITICPRRLASFQNNCAIHFQISVVFLTAIWYSMDNRIGGGAS
jgi:hypothetical protein